MLAARTRTLALGIVLAIVPCSTVALCVQEGERPQFTAEQIDRFVGLARTGSAIIRPQAADKLVAAGQPAADRLFEIAGDSNRELAALGTSLVEVLGRFGDPRLRAKLWPALEDAEFPWRPAAARSLAAAAEAQEWSRFEDFLDDPIAPVRLACIDALGAISDEGEERRAAFLKHAAAQLADENDIVRHNAALHLDRRGHGRALFWLAEDLERRDSFFGAATGESARYAAMYSLDDLAIAVGDYNPANPESAESRAALADLRKRLAARAAAMEEELPETERGLVPTELPAVARAADPVADAVLGLQLRSCRRGDYFLRWTSDDELVVGYGNPARIPLAEGSTARLVKIANETQEATAGDFYWGRPGCDMEMYSMPRAAEPKGDPQQLILSKDEQPTANLRPSALTDLGAAMAASIPAGEALASDSRTRELAERVRAAFASIGGPVVDR